MQLKKEIISFIFRIISKGTLIVAFIIVVVSYLLSTTYFINYQNSTWLEPSVEILKDSDSLYNLDNNDSLNSRNTIDKIFERLRSVNLSFNAPETMYVAQKMSIVLLMSMTVSDTALSLQLSKILSEEDIGTVKMATIKATERMEAHLTGLGFIIQTVTEVSQLVQGKGVTRWEWILQANEQGEQTLYLTVNAFIDYKGEKVTQTIETYRREIHVIVRRGTAFMNFIIKSSGWIAGITGSIITLLAGYFLAIMKERRKKKQDEKEKGDELRKSLEGK